MKDSAWLERYNAVVRERDALREKVKALEISAGDYRTLADADWCDAEAYRALRREAEAAIAYSESTGQKVARPPRMSPATVKIIIEARKP